MFSEGISFGYALRMDAHNVKPETRGVTPCYAGSNDGTSVPLCGSFVYLCDQKA